MNPEHQVRLDDILGGPWREKALLARDMLPRMGPEQLSRYLRYHFFDPITARAELDFRESFDYILEPLQLLELAVASGFLPLEAVRRHAEGEIARFLSSEPARAYLRTYDFLPVRYLAARLGAPLNIGEVRPPAINERLSVRYAVFLSTHYEFVASASIRCFLALIDDMVFGNRFGAGVFRARLDRGPADLTPQELELFRTAVSGLIGFVEDLGDFFLSVPPEERGCFGLAYGYWLSHFFGLRRVPGGYERRSVSFEGVVPPREDGGDGEGEVEAENARFRARVDVLSDVWRRTADVIGQAEAR